LATAIGEREKVEIEWRASEVTNGWKTKLVVVDVCGAYATCLRRPRQWGGELGCGRKRRNRYGGHIHPGTAEESLADKWAAVMAVGQKSGGSAGGPSLLRYGNTKHGSKVLKRAQRGKKVLPCHGLLELTHTARN
jgi:hypothetical protein